MAGASGDKWNIEASNWALDSMSDAFVLFDRGFRILHVNRACRELSNAEASDFIGKTQQELWPDLSDQVLPKFREAFQTQLPLTFLVRQAASGRSFEVRLQPSSNALAVFFSDITQRLADEDLRQTTSRSEERFKAAVGAVGILWTNNAKGEMEGEQPGWSSLTGQSPEEYEGFGWANAVHPDDQQGSLASWNDAVKHRSTYVYEHRVRRHDGIWRTFSVRAVPVLNDDGSLREWVGVHSDVTEVRDAEERLLRIQQSLGIAMSGGRMGWWSRDMSTEEVTWSPELEAIFGLPEGSFGGDRQSFLDFVHADDLESVTSSIRRSLQTGHDYSVEFRFRRHDGSEGWMEGRGRAIYDDFGKATASYGIGMDVTERKRVEVRMRENEARLRLSLNAAAAGIWLFDPNTGFTTWDEQCFRLYGLPAAERAPAFEEWLTLIHPDDREHCRNGMLFALHTGGDFNAEYRINHPKLGERWLVTTGGIIQEDQTLAGITYDATERKQQVALLESTVSIGQLLASESDPQRIVQSLCDKSTEAIGAQFGAFFYNRPDAEGRLNLYVLSGAVPADFASFPLTEDGERQRPDFPRGQTILSHNIIEDPRYPELANIPPDHLPVRSYLGVPVRSRGGQLLGELLFGHADAGRFTEQHAQLIEAFSAQAAVAYENSILLGQLTESKEDLENKVRTRTLDLERANEQMLGFTYHVSHDLRGPLRAIVATSRMLQDDFGSSLDQESRLLLTRQATAANKMGQLIDDLLKLSRLEREQLDVQAVDLTALANEAASEALASHPQSTVQVEVENGLSAHADHRLLKLAIANLIENAIKYSPSGGIVHVGQRPNGAFFVSDQGIGIETQYLEKIFEPFQRLHRDQEFAGTGIGLTNVRQVISRHGGSVWAESELEKGSTFAFRL